MFQAGKFPTMPFPRKFLHLCLKFFSCVLGSYPVVFASSLIHANGWNCPSVATVVMPHSPITACPGLVNDPSSSAIPSLWASKQNTIMQIIPSSVSDQVVLMFSVQQDIVAHDASVLVDAVMAQIQPQKYDDAPPA
jgi:hypothetical protein